jgi:glycosyltransferase involved in cell wall biosynthesis
VEIVANTKNEPRRYAFVVPRFGQGTGGAETLAKNLAIQLAGRGDKIEILSTCARDNRTWDNFYPVGVTKEDGLTVHRFSVDPRDLDSWIPKQIAINEGMNLSVEDQLAWIADSVNSSGLYEYIARESNRFDAIFFAPYLFGTTFWGSLIAPQKSVLIPCLHDEHYAYVDIIASMFRLVGKALFNALPEQELANRLYGQLSGGEVGMGFDAPMDDDIKELSPLFNEKFPYILYLGRKETGKNAQVLIDNFIELKDSGKFPELRLVIAGGGSFEDLHRPNAAKRDDIIDLDHVSELDKRRLLKYSLALCQPSTNESFSIVIMEAWLMGAPVIVHGGCPVTLHHVLESGGGLYFRTGSDFAQVISELISNTSLRSELARSGKKYVLEVYSWPAVLARFDKVMAELPLARESSSVSI